MEGGGTAVNHLLLCSTSVTCMVGPRGGGGLPGLKHARMCVSKMEGNGSFFGIK